LLKLFIDQSQIDHSDTACVYPCWGQIAGNLR